MTVITGCRLCQRLVEYREKVKTRYPQYHCKPVGSFGVNRPRLLIVGLAPGLHGANATGRPFTGDASGKLLFETLYKFGFSSASNATSAADAMNLIDCRLTNAVKCLPPQNKPLASEVACCNPYLSVEIDQLTNNAMILALGRVAHTAVLRALGMRQNQFSFGHLREHEFNAGLSLIDSYHCSRYNIQTRRLSVVMFERVFERIRRKFDGE